MTSDVIAGGQPQEDLHSSTSRTGPTSPPESSPTLYTKPDLHVDTVLPYQPDSWYSKAEMSVLMQDVGGGDVGAQILQHDPSSASLLSELGSSRRIKYSPSLFPTTTYDYPIYSAGIDIPMLSGSSVQHSGMSEPLPLPGSQWHGYHYSPSTQSQSMASPAACGHQFHENMLQSALDSATGYQGFGSHFPLPSPPYSESQLSAVCHSEDTWLKQSFVGELDQNQLDPFILASTYNTSQYPQLSSPHPCTSHPDQAYLSPTAYFVSNPALTLPQPSK